MSYTAIQTFYTMQKCLWGVHKWGTETINWSGWGVDVLKIFLCHTVGSRLLYMQFQCKEFMWQKVPARLPYTDGGSCGDGDVGLSSTTWCVSSQVCVCDIWGTEPEGQMFLEQWLWGTFDFTYTHTHSFFPLSPRCPLLHKGINSPPTLTEGAEGQQEMQDRDGWTTFLHRPRDFINFHEPGGSRLQGIKKKKVGPP